jgi:hypothetical protein
MISVNEAYNKGLDDAENVAIPKLTNALNGVDDGPFNNPRMEEIRVNILNKPVYQRDYNYVLDILLDKDIDTSTLGDVDNVIVEILKYCKSFANSRSSSKVTVKMKEFLTKLTVDLINKRDKLS